jgi:glutathione S-transferase
MLEHHSWLLGDQPSVADFSVYHALWFTRHQVPPVAGILESVPAVLPWMDCLASIGHGAATQMTAEAALTIARDSSPMTLEDEIHQDDHGITLGSNVAITAESFGLEPTVGRLVAATRTRYTLSREDAQLGQVHIHFPRMGFLMKKAEPS